MRFKLTDFDSVTRSSLSTCVLVDESDIGRLKVDAVADRLRALGMEVICDPVRLQLDNSAVHTQGQAIVVAVDNLLLRRSLDRLRNVRVLEVGIGDGVDAFTRVQFHEFPGPRKAQDVWAGDDARSSHRVDISKPAYQTMLRETGDECGTAMIAGRSIATPFVGAFAGAVQAWLYGGTSVPNGALAMDVYAL